MKAKIYISLALLVVTLLSVAQNKPWTIQQCVDTALANNRNVKQQALTKQNRAIAYQQARQNLLPNLNASASQNWNFGRSLAADNTYKSSNSSQSSFGLSSGITLFDGMRMKYNIDAAKVDMYASDADLEKVKQDITMNVAMGFMQILLNKELLQIANDQLALTKTKLEHQRALVDAGKLPEGELLDLMAQESKEDMNCLQAKNSLNLSLLDLAQFLELDNFQQLDVVAPDNISQTDVALLSVDAVLEGALTHRPEIKGAEYRLQSSEYNVLIAKSNYYPSLSLGANYGTGYYKMSSFTNSSFGQQLSDNMSASVGLNLRIPIFNKYEVRNGVRSAQLGVSSSKINIDNAKLELKKSIQQAYYNALAAKARWDAAQKSESASREAFRFTNQKFEAGRATLYELYQAKSNLAQVLSEQVQAKYQYFFRVKMLELFKS